jgi:hypothetical protein
MLIKFMSKMQIGVWPLPTDVINALLGTNIEDGKLVHLTPLGRLHIEKRHPQDAEKISNFLYQNWLENPVLIGAIDERINLVYRMDGDEKGRFLMVVICEDYHKKFLSIMTSFLISKETISNRIRNCKLYRNSDVPCIDLDKIIINHQKSEENKLSEKDPYGFRNALLSTTAYQSVSWAARFGNPILRPSLF